MRKNKAFLAFLMFFLYIFTCSSYAVTWEPNTYITFIHSNVVVYHQNNETFEEIIPQKLPLDVGFTPVSVDEGDIITITLFASGDLVNYGYLGEQSCGIESFNFTIFQVNNCGNSVIRESCSIQDIKTAYYIYEVKGLEPGFYRMELEAVSKTADYKTTTINSKDELINTTFLFSVGSVGDFITHKNISPQAFYKEGENGEEASKTIINRQFSLAITKDTKLYFKNISPEIAQIVYYVDSADDSMKVLQVDDSLCLYDILPKGKRNYTLYLAYQYKDGCIGPYFIGHISY